MGGGSGNGMTGEASSLCCWPLLSSPFVPALLLQELWARGHSRWPGCTRAQSSCSSNPRPNPGEPPKRPPHRVRSGPSASHSATSCCAALYRTLQLLSLAKRCTTGSRLPWLPPGPSAAAKALQLSTASSRTLSWSVGPRACGQPGKEGSQTTTTFPRLPSACCAPAALLCPAASTTHPPTDQATRPRPGAARLCSSTHRPRSGP
jgi:hypothetical protein